MVGCVIVRGGRIVGEGHHRRFGGPHAEVNALKNCGGSLRTATVYVSLEPCCHQGKTGPCTEALISGGVRRIVIACRDPFKAVSGKGILQLRGAGIEVRVGCLEAEAREMNAPFIMRCREGRPWVIAKWAQSLDGKIATASGDSKWISSAASRRLVHGLRGRVDAVVTGVGTVIADDPALTCRDGVVKRVAHRVVLDSRLRIPLDCRLVRTARRTPTWIATTKHASLSKRGQLEKKGCRVIVCRGGSGAVDIGDVLARLGGESMTNVLVEAGGQVAGAFHDAGLIDEVYAFVTPMLIGGRGAISPLSGTGVEQVKQATLPRGWTVRRVGGDLLVTARLRTV
jgi:diaminohydroxyphosphoribosylaminopyrimidine deaminase/5-amino-6-(5-phosphoribosylamino)uracil reductase